MADTDISPEEIQSKLRLLRRPTHKRPHPLQVGIGYGHPTSIDVPLEAAVSATQHAPGGAPVVQDRGAAAAAVAATAAKVAAQPTPLGMCALQDRGGPASQPALTR